MRLSVVVPIGVIVAVAIVCVVVAVLSSAQRADEVALNTERQLFTRALANHGERVLREIESVSTSEVANRRIRVEFDHAWVQIYVGLRLQSSFDHDFVFIADAADRFLYASLGLRSVDPNWFNSIQPDLRGARRGARSRQLRWRRPRDRRGKNTGLPRAVRLQGFLGRPALVAAVAVTTPNDVSPKTGAEAPIVLSVKFIDDDVLADIASRLLLRNLHKVDKGPVAAGDHVFDLTDQQGRSIAQFAWTPKQPGAEIVHSVAPFIAIALAAFALLVGLVLGHMRRTAQPSRRARRDRYLGLQDPLCGLPNRIFFGDRLEAIIAKVRQGGPTAAVFTSISTTSRTPRHARPSGRR